ncbi:hypothetical protein JCM8547_006374 [Rhodosporidiobolus lusitaniae]
MPSPPPPPSARPSELPHAPPQTLQSLPLSALHFPGPALATFPGQPSFQDLTDDSGEGSSGNEGEGEEGEGVEEWVARAQSLLPDAKVATMDLFLRERGLFAFLKRYLEGYGPVGVLGGGAAGAGDSGRKRQDWEDGRDRMPAELVLMAFGVRVRPGTSLADQFRMVKIACSKVLRNRDKLDSVNTPQDVVELIRRSRNILVLTGAGVSTSCGIPDFRSPTGLYARLKEEHWELDDPQDMFDLQYFKEKPNVFYSFAKEIYPSNFVPSPCHRFVRLLEMNGRLLRNYTQNIDGLFELVGCEKMLNCHGSFATASCLLCHRRFPGSAIEADVFASRVPLCPYCTPLLKEEEREREEREKEEPPRKKKKRNEWEEDSEEEEEERRREGRGEWDGKALVKPDIVFFGEALSDEFDRRLLEDREEVDLLLVMGTSLRVSPVAQLPSHLPHSIPQVLINRDPVAHHQFDVCLLGDGDTVVQWLCEELAKAPLPSSAAEDEKPSTSANGYGEAKPSASGEWDLNARVPIAVPPHPTSSSATSSASHPLPSLPSGPHGSSPSHLPLTPERVGSHTGEQGSHVWLFPGANRESKWVEAVRRAYSDPEGGESSLTSLEEDGEDGEEGGGEGTNGKENGDEAVEIPASLAFGAKEGVPSDGEDGDGDEGDESEDGTEARLAVE